MSSTPRDPKTVIRYLATPITGLIAAWRIRDRVTLIVGAIAAALAAYGMFAYNDLALYAALGVLTGQSLWITHSRTVRLRDTDPAIPSKLIYGSGLVLAFPLAYTQLMLVGLLVSLAIAAIALFVVYLLFAMFTGASSPSRGTVTRGANSHVNSDGTPKISYLSIDDAQDAAMNYFNDRGERMNAYRCGDGDHFHIGHAK